jgi:hypothetical protein
MQVKCQLSVADPIDLDSYPTADAHIRWSIEFLWRLFDQRFLNADRCRNRDRNVSVVVVVV